VLLVHPGGPFWHKKDVGAWSIPKGEYGAGEKPEEVARREFREEIGIELT
jgi:predicted NUDIX family NTP pyrophosphohydrolase